MSSCTLLTLQIKESDYTLTFSLDIMLCMLTVTQTKTLCRCSTLATGLKRHRGWRRIPSLFQDACRRRQGCWVNLACAAWRVPSVICHHCLFMGGPEGLVLKTPRLSFRAKVSSNTPPTHPHATHMPPTHTIALCEHLQPLMLTSLLKIGRQGENGESGDGAEFWRWNKVVGQAEGMKMCMKNRKL